MILLIYRGLGHESRAFKDATHVIVDSSVTVIKRNAFHDCKHLVSLIMGDSVKRIEGSLSGSGLEPWALAWSGQALLEILTLPVLSRLVDFGSRWDG